MKALKRIVLGSLLFLTVVFLGACATSTTTASTVNETTQGITTEATTFVVEIITNGDNPETTEVETEYVSNSKVIAFDEEDTLLALLRANFTVYCADANGDKDETCSYDGGFGRYLVGIDTLDATAVTNGYISFYIDGSYAMSGVDATPLEDGRVYSFKLETY
ncbi:MAG: hypothetical protein RBQ64_00160 [Candidatus Izemoplasmatales bacterium]|jgi:hypothetical protein|nr:hypothetical protein [Candidatus Izemoplasmatales bacterium]